MVSSLSERPEETESIQCQSSVAISWSQQIASCAQICQHLRAHGLFGSASCIGTTKALLGLRSKHFGCVLSRWPRKRGFKRLRFLGLGQSADDKVGPSGEKRELSMHKIGRWMNFESVYCRQRAVACGVMIGGQVPRQLGWGEAD